MVMFRTHLAIGFLIGLFSLKIINIGYPILFVILVTLFSSIPDIDHPKSKIGKKLWFLSIPISFVFKHRGFFHSIFPALLLFFALNYFNLPFLALAVLIGYIAHLIGDAITKEGINFLHPVSTFKVQGFITTNSFLELILLLLVITLDIVYTLSLINLI